MSIDEADQPTPVAGARSDVAGVRPDAVAPLRSGGAGVRSDAVAPLLRTLGDPGAAVCADGFCEVPPGQLAAPGQPAPGQAVTTGADE